MLKYWWTCDFLAAYILEAAGMSELVMTNTFSKESCSYNWSTKNLSEQFQTISLCLNENNEKIIETKISKEQK